MPIIENHTEHPFEFPAPPRKTEAGTVLPSNRDELLKIPPQRPKTLGDGSKELVPGRVTVSKEKLEAMRAHPVAKHWFGPTSLVVVSDEVKAKG